MTEPVAITDLLDQEIAIPQNGAKRHEQPTTLVSISPATPGRDTRLPRTKVLDFDAWSLRVHSRMAGLLLTVPDLVAFDMPGLAQHAGYPGTRVVPATGWLLSLLALKLTTTRRLPGP